LFLFRDEMENLHRVSSLRFDSVHASPIEFAAAQILIHKWRHNDTNHASGFYSTNHPGRATIDINVTRSIWRVWPLHRVHSKRWIVC